MMECLLSMYEAPSSVLSAKNKSQPSKKGNSMQNVKHTGKVRWLLSPVWNHLEAQCPGVPFEAPGAAPQHCPSSRAFPQPSDFTLESRLLCSTLQRRSGKVTSLWISARSSVLSPLGGRVGIAADGPRAVSALPSMGSPAVGAAAPGLCQRGGDLRALGPAVPTPAAVAHWLRSPCRRSLCAPRTTRTGGQRAWHTWRSSCAAGHDDRAQDPGREWPLQVPPLGRVAMPASCWNNGLSEGSESAVPCRL